MPVIPTHILSRHPEFFFTDGNVVVITGFLAFRLHRGIVNRWSPSFSDMLDALDAAADPWTFEGKGAIVLDDDPLDMERLVRVLYDGSVDLTCTARKFKIISSILTLSRKYSITQLHTHTLAHLLVAYPLTLSAWDTREAYTFTPKTRYHRINILRERYAHPLAVVSLALQLDAPYLLVPAYLDLARFPVSEIIRGYTTLSSSAPTPSDTPVSTLHLPPTQTTAVLRGKETLQRFIADFIKASIENRAPSPLCRYSHLHTDTDADNVQGYPCDAAFTRVAHEMLVMTAEVEGGVDSDPLFVLLCAVEMLKEPTVDTARKYEVLEVSSEEPVAEEAGKIMEAGQVRDPDLQNSAGEDASEAQDTSGGGEQEWNSACAACTEAFKQNVDAARQHVWASLGKWFDLRKVLESGFGAGGWE